MVNRIASPKPLQGVRSLEFPQINSNSNLKPSGQTNEQSKKQEIRPPIKPPSINDTNTLDQKSSGLLPASNPQQHAIGNNRTEQITDNERKDVIASSNSSSPNSLPSKTQ